MMTIVCGTICLLLIGVSCVYADELPESKPNPRLKWQYQSDGIEVAAATPDEPRVEFGTTSLLAAVKYLDDGAVSWTRERSCIACHTTGSYMAERPGLAELLGRPKDEVRADFVAFVPDDDPAPRMRNGKKVFSGGVVFSVWRSLGLAEWDKHITGELSEATKRSLRDTLLRQADNGFWPTVNKVEIPHTTTEFELGVQVARAMTAAPGWLERLQDDELLDRVERLRIALREHQPRNDYERALQLQLAAVMPDVLNPASDPYMTAFAIVLLRQSGVPTSDQRIQSGITWLKSNQRESGCWWMKSLYKDTYNFITYVATVQALKALALCDEIPIR